MEHSLIVHIMAEISHLKCRKVHVIVCEKISPVESTPSCITACQPRCLTADREYRAWNQSTVEIISATFMLFQQKMTAIVVAQAVLKQSDQPEHEAAAKFHQICIENS